MNKVMATKSEIRKAIFNHHYNDMMNIVKTKTKLENILVVGTKVYEI